MKTLSLRIARWAGILPVTLGVGTTLLWMATGERQLMFFGLLMVFVGTGCVVAGMVCLGVYYGQVKRHPEVNKDKVLRQVLWVLLLYVGNFVAAGGCFVGAMKWMGRCLVVIDNQSPAVMRSVVIQGAGVKINVGNIAPGEQVSKAFWVPREGILTLDGTGAKGPVQVELTGYVTPQKGMRQEVTISPEGVVEVREQREVWMFYFEGE